MSCALNETAPSLALMRLHNIPTKVDLPTPFGPISARICPSGSEKSTSLIVDEMFLYLAETTQRVDIQYPVLSATSSVHQGCYILLWLDKN